MRSLVLLLILAARPASAELLAAAGKVDISPDLSRHRIYMAGFGAKGRRPVGIHDPLTARVLVLREGRTTVAIVGLDLLGFYRNDVLDLRARAGFTGEGRYLFVSATHQHSGPDTLGLWGPFIGVSGVAARYHSELKDKVAAKIKELESALVPASLEAFSAPTDPRGLCRDSRDPVVINPYLAALRLKARDGKALATVVNWSCHPEVLGRTNRLLTADFPGPLCDQVEEGGGGACVFLNGTIGGLMTPDIKDDKENFYEAQRIGSEVGRRALKGLASARKADKPALSYASKTVRVPVENSRYLSFLPALVFGHKLYDRDGNALPKWKTRWLALKHVLLRLGDADRPWVETEVSRIDLGPVRLLGIPGELFPEVAVGGYDGKFRAGHPLIMPDNPDPPDLAKAPKGPYLMELLGAPVPIVVGLANDELGYLLPEYDFKTRGTLTMLPRMPGHYEETNSIGRSATGIIAAAAAELTSARK
jgi:hypothetical protein